MSVSRSAAALAMALVAAGAASTLHAADAPKTEKCYGVAKAGTCTSIKPPKAFGSLSPKG